MTLKKFCALTLSALFIATAPVEVSAELSEDLLAAEFAVDTEKFIDSLPVAKGKYKSRQRPILIGGAMNSEIGLLVRALKNPVIYKHLNYIYIAGTYKNYPVVISRTEEFMPNAAATTALALTNFNPIAVINQGTAGGYVENLFPHDIVIARSAINTSAIKTDYQPKGAGSDANQYEMIGDYAYDKNSGKFKIFYEFTSDPTLLKLAESIKGFNTMTGVIGSTAGWNNNIDHINYLNERHGALCEEMETVAIAQLCYGSGVPFIGVRGISNNITNKSSYTPEAAESAQKFTLILVEKYIDTILKKN